MAASSKTKLRQGPLDQWSTREKLALACSILKSGDQNLVSVSRAIKPFGEPNRPSDWFSQKNCALQYSDMLEKVETTKRKRGDRGETDTAQDQIVRRLTIERLEELKRLIVEGQQKYKKLKKEVEEIKSGQYDDTIHEYWERVQKEQREAEEAAREAERKMQEEAAARASAKSKSSRRSVMPSSISEADDSTQDSISDSVSLDITASLEEDLPQTPTALAHLQIPPPGTALASGATGADGRPKGAPPTSPLLSSLLLSKLKSSDDLQQLKNEQEQEHLKQLQKEKVPQVQQQQQQSQQQQPQQQQPQQQQPQSASGQQLPQQPAPSQAKQPVDVKPVLQSPLSAGASLSLDSPGPALTSTPIRLVPQTSSLPATPSSAAPTLSKLLNMQGQKTQPSTSTAAIVTVAESSAPLAAPKVAVAEPPAPVAVSSASSSSGEKTSVEKREPARVEVKIEVQPPQDTKDFNPPLVPAIPSHTKQTEAPAAVETESPSPSVRKETKEEKVEVMAVDSKDEIVVEVQEEREDSQTEVAGSSSVVEDEISLSIKEEPASPASSVSSRLGESGGKVTRRGRGRGRGRRSGRIYRKSITEEEKKDDGSSKHSEAEFTDEDVVHDSDDTSNVFPYHTSSLAASESIPNSPASLSMCSDTEDEKAYKSWKKSIMLVWRAAANHKSANIFMHPVTDDIAPGYRNVVYRPMDLGTIKKNIETGVIRTTNEFQRDMMLMFTNAIMYNSSDHDVYKIALDMYEDAMQHIEQYQSTQLMLGDAKMLRASRRGESHDKEEESKKRRLSTDHQAEGGKSKKLQTGRR